MLRPKILAKLRKGGLIALKIAPMVVTIASAISAITPNPVDDTVWAAIHQMIDVIALNVGHSAQPPL